MTDKPKDDVLPVSDPYRVATVFVNRVVGSGHFCGVANLTFAVAQFTPKPDGSIDPDLVVATRLRMDLACARQLYETLGRILEQNISPTNGTTH